MMCTVLPSWRLTANCGQLKSFFQLMTAFRAHPPFPRAPSASASAGVDLPQYLLGPADHTCLRGNQGLLPIIRFTAFSFRLGRSCPRQGNPIRSRARCRTTALCDASSTFWTWTIRPAGLLPTYITPCMKVVTVQPASFNASTISAANLQGSGCPPTHETAISPFGFAAKSATSSARFSAVKWRSLMRSCSSSKACSASAARCCCLASSISTFC